MSLPTADDMARITVPGWRYTAVGSVPCSCCGAGRGQPCEPSCWFNNFIRSRNGHEPLDHT